MPLDHDARCEAQDRELTLLKEQFRIICRDLDSTVTRVQLLVDQMHAQNVFQATLSADVAHIKQAVDVIETTLKEEVASKVTVDSMRKWGTMIAASFILAFAGALWAWIIKGGLKP
jgi:hypothetical protein